MSSFLQKKDAEVENRSIFTSQKNKISHRKINIIFFRFTRKKGLQTL